MEQSRGEGNSDSSSSGASNPKPPPRGILARSGLPLPPGARLSSSIRAPRDLTLGGTKFGAASRKNFVPNLTKKTATSSNLNGSEGAVSQQVGLRKQVGEPRGRGRGRGRGGSDGGRGRGRGRGVNLVQLDGIFEAGAAAPGGSWSSGGGGGGTGGISKDTSLPKYIPMEQEDCEDTKETINRLTRADFVDYGDEDDEGELPLMIPLTTARYGKTCKVEDYNGPDEATTDSQEGGHSQSEKSPMDIDSTTEDKRPIKVAKPTLEVDPSTAAQRLLMMLCLAENCTKAEEEGKHLTVFQLPRLPGPSKASQEGTKNLPQRSSKSAKTQGETPPLQYKLKDISKGYFGKLQILRDGRVRLVSGNVSMELQMASELPLYQELVEIQGRMIIPLAKVENKVVCRLNSSDLIGKEADNTNDGDSGSKPFT